MGVLNFDLGKDVLLESRNVTHTYTNFHRKIEPIFIPEPQVVSKNLNEISQYLSKVSNF